MLSVHYPLVSGALSVGFHGICIGRNQKNKADVPLHCAIFFVGVEFLGWSRAVVKSSLRGGKALTAGLSGGSCAPDIWSSWVRAGGILFLALQRSLLRRHPGQAGAKLVGWRAK